MIREEREAARVEREAAAAEARVGRETAAAEQRRLMAEVFELKLPLTEERGRRSGIAGGGPLTAGSCGGPRGPVERAVQSDTAAGSDRIIKKQRLGLTAGCISSPCVVWEANLLQALHVREPRRAAETATAELCGSNGKTVRLK